MTQASNHADFCPTPGAFVQCPCLVVCRAVFDETAQAKSFVLEDKLGRSFFFKPGQYATLKLLIDGKILQRAYSIASAPTRPGNLQITVKRVPGGVGSNWLNDTLVVGTEIEIMAIDGAFNFSDLPSDKPLLLSGGSGITPVMSMLRALTDSASDLDITFVHFARDPADVIFRDELALIAKRFTNVTVQLVVGEARSDPAFTGTRGRISADLLRQLVPDHAERTIYMCGPEGFMRAARDITAEVTVKAQHQESFGQALPAIADGGLGQQVEFTLSGSTRTCAPGETLLQVALDAGIWVESSCQQGICGSCKVRLLEGAVDMTDLGGLQEYERNNGYVLACCSRPTGPVRLEI